ncbi:hypothetical protein TNIN_148911 [Trichonephila inaurata madagascariensis]|uniref:Uncharacterized protein n=1 Tax=Trichonephila inaurata madagascariensis TaxID=2747483 RepID=A0A8X6YVY1_9ARAC|nr:hypothetical protein TNIN_148911 [Trichonephila inaurata madagascariensis]
MFEHFRGSRSENGSNGSGDRLLTLLWYTFLCRFRVIFTCFFEGVGVHFNKFMFLLIFEQESDLNKKNHGSYLSNRCCNHRSSTILVPTV